MVTTCSEQNVSWMRSLGADEIVDYKQPDAVQRVVECVQKNGLYTILDCIGKESTAEFCSKCFTPPQDEACQPEYVYAPLMPLSKEFPTATSLPSSVTVQNRWKFVYTCFGKRFTTLMDHPAINGTWQPSVEDKAFMIDFYRRFETILASGKISFMPQEVRLGGLQTILSGVSDVRAGKVYGKKLVYPIMTLI